MKTNLEKTHKFSNIRNESEISVDTKFKDYNCFDMKNV